MPPEMPTHVTLQSIIASFPQPNRDALQYLEYSEDEVKFLYSSLLRRRLHGASDGSVKTYGSFGFLLCDTKEEYKLHGMGLVPQTSTQVNSQRAEYYGGFALVTLLKALLIWGGDTTLSLKLPSWIDNQHVVDTDSLSLGT